MTTFAEPCEAPRLATTLTPTDRIGAIRVRFGLGRDRYLIQPGLYRVGEPGRASPVLVTANYKLTVDIVRLHLDGIDAWLLVLDTRGVNVWCAAGKGTFGTDELILRLLDSGVQARVDHRTLIVPQLGAPGVAAHDVRRATGFRVVYGPVHVRDLPDFLVAGMQATPEMRRVTFDMPERLTVAGVGLSVLWDPRVLAAVGLSLVLSWSGVLPWSATLLLLASGTGAVVAGGLLVPLALPWIPGRMLSVKGGLAGALTGAAIAAAAPASIGLAAHVAVLLGTTSVASFIAMDFTGSTTYTSPSGVAWEMRRAIPVQAAMAAVALLALAVSLLR